jgi:hypothetical protein
MGLIGAYVTARFNAANIKLLFINNLRVRACSGAFTGVRVCSGSVLACSGLFGFVRISKKQNKKTLR